MTTQSERAVSVRTPVRARSGRRSASSDRLRIRRIGPGDRGKNRALTVADLLHLWTVEGRRSWKPSYLDVIETDCRKHFAPALGARPLRALCALDIHTWLGELDDSGLAPQTVLRLYRELHAALACGVRLGLLSANPAAAVRSPRVLRQEAGFLDASSASRLLAASAGTRLHALTYIAIETGARKGELLALRWADLDLDRREFRVRRTAREYAGRGVEFGTPKTYRSRRAVSLSLTAVVVLNRHWSALAREREDAGARWQDEDLVFPSEVGTPQRPANLRRSFQSIAKRAGLSDLRFHALRHTSASLMADAGVSVATISAQLGHSRPSITQDIYTHVLPRRQDEAAAAVAAALVRSGGSPERVPDHSGKPG